MDKTGKKIRMLLTKSDQDAHESALRYIAQTLRNAGLEVIYTRYETIEMVVKTALEEDVDVIGIQYYGSGLMYEVPVLMNLLKQQKMEDIKVILGGTITPQEKEKLLGVGVCEVFLPGQGTVDQIPEFVKRVVGHNN